MWFSWRLMGYFGGKNHWDVSGKTVLYNVYIYIYGLMVLESDWHAHVCVQFMMQVLDNMWWWARPLVPQSRSNVIWNNDSISNSIWLKWLKVCIVVAWFVRVVCIVKDFQTPSLKHLCSRQPIWFSRQFVFACNIGTKHMRVVFILIDLQQICQSHSL